MSDLERLSPQSLVRKERQVAPIKKRYRQEVDEAKLEAQHDREHRDAGKSLVSLLASHLRYHDGTAQSFTHRGCASDDARDSHGQLPGHRYRGLGRAIGGS